MEYERIREEALLTDEIGVLVKKYSWVVTGDEKRAELRSLAVAVAQAQLDKDGIEIRAKDQSLPEIPEFQYDEPDKREWLKQGAIKYSKMLSGFVKVEPKGGKE